ncbi:MAG: hypothetical protein IJU91_03775, partial [Selenomonadaceae bacterium]|nr:hypothetical protein [Selenomonadaceae bacterium]
GVIYFDINAESATDNLPDDSQEEKIVDAIKTADGKIIVTLLNEGGEPMAYVYNKDYKKIRLDSDFAYRLIDEGRAEKISPAEFDAMINPPDVDAKKSARELEKIINMALRIKKQFANAYVTADGKFMFYADHGGVTMEQGATKWNPTFYVVSKDLFSPRVSLDIITQEVIPQNVFVEITKEDLAKARRIAKTSGTAAALKYLEPAKIS